MEHEAQMAFLRTREKNITFQIANPSSWPRDHVAAAGIFYETHYFYSARGRIKIKKTIQNSHALQALKALNNTKHQAIQSLQCLNSSLRFSWDEVLSIFTSLLWNYPTINASECFLCAPLHRSLLLPLPVYNVSNQTTSECSLTPLLGTPLPPLPPYLKLTKCWAAQISNCPGSSYRNVTVRGQTSLGPGLAFLCSSRVYTCTSTDTSVPCLPIALVPSLTLYTSGEIQAHLEAQETWVNSLTDHHPRTKRAATLAVLVVISLVSAVAATRLAAGSLGHTLVTAQRFSQELQQLNTELITVVQATAQSIQTLQRQLSSLVEVTLQNRRALDLLTAEKGRTCLFQEKNVAILSMSLERWNKISSVCRK